MLKRKKSPAHLFAVFNGMTNVLADSGFTVTGGASGADYDLSGNTLTIKSSKPLTISAGTADSPITGQIVIQPGISANLTLDGVNLNGEEADLLGNRAKSAIELSSNSSLSLTLNQNTNNTLTGGSVRIKVTMAIYAVMLAVHCRLQAVHPQPTMVALGSAVELVVVVGRAVVDSPARDAARFFYWEER